METNHFSAQGPVSTGWQGLFARRWRVQRLGATDQGHRHRYLECFLEYWTQRVCRNLAMNVSCVFPSLLEAQETRQPFVVWMDRTSLLRALHGSSTC